MQSTFSIIIYQQQDSVSQKKRASINSPPKENVYRIPKVIFDNLFKKIPELFHYNFDRVFNVSPLEKTKNFQMIIDIILSDQLTNVSCK